LAISHKEIAEIAGVSIGTVDRALHRRGRVSAKTQERIEEVALQYGYTPNIAGKALAKAKNPVRIGVVIHQTRIPFYQQVLSGVYKARTEIAGLSGELIIKGIESVEEEAHIEAVNELVEMGVDGLCVTPVENAALRDCLNGIRRNKNIPIVTFNTDMAGLERICFIGMDNIRSGRTAAGLMNFLLGDRHGKVLVISSYAINRANAQRLDGFIQEIADRYNGIEIIGIQFNMDEEQAAYRITASVLEGDPALAGIYMVSGGQSGTCRAIEESGCARQVKLIVHDLLPETIEYINKGVIDFIIDQNAFEQGYRSSRVLYSYLFEGTMPESEYLYTDINIKTMQNL